MSRKMIFLDVDGTLVDYRNNIPQSAIDAISQARGLEFYLESTNGFFASGNFRDVSVPVMKIYSMRKGKTSKEVEHLEVEDAFHGIVFGEELYRDDLNKVSFILSDYQDHLDSIEEFPNLEDHTWGGTRLFTS